MGGFPLLSDKLGGSYGDGLEVRLGTLLFFLSVSFGFDFCVAFPSSTENGAVIRVKVLVMEFEKPGRLQRVAIQARRLTFSSLKLFQEYPS